MSPFAVYRNTYIGNNWLMFRAMKSGGMSPMSMLPMLTFQMVYLATAGAAGIMLTDEWNELARMWNHFVPEKHLPDATEAFMKFANMVHMNKQAGDIFTFGMLSNSTKLIPGFGEGTYFGSSL